MGRECVLEDLEITLARIRKRKLEACLKVARLEAELAETESFIMNRESELQKKKIIAQEDTKEELPATISLLNVLTDDTSLPKNNIGNMTMKRKKPPENNYVVDKKRYNDVQGIISTDLRRCCYKYHDVGHCKNFNELNIEQGINLMDTKNLGLDCSLKTEGSPLEKCQSRESHHNLSSPAEDLFSNSARREEAHKKISNTLLDSKEEKFDHIKKKIEDRKKKPLTGEKRKMITESKRSKNKYSNVFKGNYRQESGKDHVSKLTKANLEKAINRSNSGDRYALGLDKTEDLSLELVHNVCSERKKKEANVFGSLRRVTAPDEGMKSLDGAKKANNEYDDRQSQTVKNDKCKEGDCIVCKTVKDSGESYLDALEKDHAKEKAFDKAPRPEGKVSAVHRLKEEARREPLSRSDCCGFRRDDANKENKGSDDNAASKKINHCRLSQICSLLYPNVKR